jgi:hypothetical protein
MSEFVHYYKVSRPGSGNSWACPSPVEDDYGGDKSWFVGILHNKLYKILGLMKQIIKAILFFIFLLPYWSCKKFVQIDPPNTQLVTASVFNNSATATSAQTYIYTKMATAGVSWNISQNCGLLSDELKNWSSNATEVQLYTNAMLSSNNPGQWSTGYNLIYQSNAIIAAMQNNASISAVIAQQLTGESKFVRAFWHFYLTNMYGDVPIVTTADYTVNEKISRSPQAQVYQQIISDLVDAQNLLNANYVNATDTLIISERARPNKSAAQALLARVYLYTKKYDSAETEATTVINNTQLYNLCSNLSGPNSVFLKNSTEAIWQLSTPLPASYNTIDGSDFILKSAPSNTSVAGSTTISPQLLSTFETGDQRKVSWIGTYSTASPAVSYYYPYKYQSYNSSTVTEYVMVLRLAEQFLIRAEARAYQGELTDAISDLNIIRKRAGLTPYPGSTTDQNAIIAAIMHERQVELFAEWGQRWFDLIRTGAIDSVMGTSGVCQSKGGTWYSTSKFFPISLTEIGNDPNLVQNSGY